MKKILVIFCLSIAISTNAQRPKAGNKLINAGFMDFGPRLNGGFLVLKKYKDSVNAYRFGMSFVSNIYKQNLNSDGMVITAGEEKLYNSSFNMFVGKQRNFLITKRFEPYVAGDLSLDVTNHLRKLDSHITDTLYDKYFQSIHNYPSFTKKSIGDYIHQENKYPFKIGVCAIVSLGFNYFLFKNLAIGAEFRASVAELSYRTSGTFTEEAATNGVYERTENRLKGKGELEINFAGAGFITMSYCIR
jgi:hypothetical protein